MLDAVREPTLPDSPRTSRRAFVIQSLLYSTALLTLDTLHTTKTAQATDDGTEEPEHVEKSDSAQIKYLQEWMQSNEGILMKRTLEKAIDSLNDPSFATRQEATETIMKSMEYLRAMIHPFPEELRAILGTGLLEDRLYEEHARKNLYENHDYTWPESSRLTEMHDVWRSQNFHRAPRIMPGEYSTEELREALEEQTGIKFVIDGKTLNEKLQIQPNANTWIDAASELRKRTEGGSLHYEQLAGAIRIGDNPGQYSQTLLEGTCIFVHSAGEDSSTFIAMVPTAGNLVRTIESCTTKRNFLFLSLPKKSEKSLPRSLAEIICANSDTQTTIENEENTAIKALATDPVRSMTIPFGQQTAVGRYQLMHVEKQRTLNNQHTVFIRIDSNPPLVTYHPLSGEGGIFNMVAKGNRYSFKNAQGHPIDATIKESGDIRWNSSQYITYSLDEEPAEVTVAFVANVREVTIRPPLACLPKNINP